MNRLKFLIGLLIYCLTYSVYGQIKCSKENLIGQWRQVESIPGVYSNVDSLKRLIVESYRHIGTLDFSANGILKYAFLDTPDKKGKKYILDTLTCEIILGTKRNARKNSNLKIVYLDNQFLIFSEDNNPKGYITHLTVKMDKTVK